MKYKIIGFFFVTVLTITIYNTINTYAYDNFFIGNDGGGIRFYYCNFTSDSLRYTYGYYDCYYSSVSTNTYSTIDEAITAALNSASTNGLSGSYRLWSGMLLLPWNVTYTFVSRPDNFNFDNVYTDYEDYLDRNPPPPDPTWYESLWLEFQDIVNDIEDALGEYFNITPLMDFFDDLWTVKVGEGEDQLTKFPLATPTPIPAPPTPIPYQTIMTPDGNGGYTINYYYTNPSGTPIVTSSPPVSNNTYVDNDFEYPYYENPDNVDNPYEFKIPWYLKLILKGNNVDVDQLDDEYQIAEQTVQSDEVLNAVDNIYDGFQVIPSGWLFMLGAIAALPLFAALIHRMLNG